MTAPDNDIDRRLELLDESIADGKEHVVPDVDLEQFSDCLRLADRVRHHTPGCIADLLADDDLEAMWLDESQVLSAVLHEP